MPVNKAKQLWEAHRANGLADVIPILSALGFGLNKVQIHTEGERYLTSGKKFVLTGWRLNDGKCVVIKISNHPQGRQEIERERKSRIILEKINFAYHVFFSPEEILFTYQQGYILFITSFIEQERKFLELPFKEQFFLALKAFETQEGVHATTYEHANIIRESFGIWNARTYLKKSDRYLTDIALSLSKNTKIKTLLIKAREFLTTNSKTIDLYSGFLTHWDFVPHNFRIRGRDIYLLDHSSIRFGNKYESWARFTNFMVLYNPVLEQALVEYVRKNRAEEESLSLRLMRVFRLTELICHYANTLPKISGDLHTLNQKRIEFWEYVLEAALNNQSVPQEIIEEYKNRRDSLRSEEEKQRQKVLH